MKLSYSSISLHESCPLAWKFRYVDKLPGKSKHYFSFGKAVHAALESMYDPQRGECPPAQDVVDAFFDHWSDAGYKDAAAIRKGQREGEAMLRAYHLAHAKAWKPALYVEFKFDFNVDHVRVTGFIDRIDIAEGGGLRIVDYKTGRELEPGRHLTDDQLTSYQMAVVELGLGEVVEVAFDHVPSLAAPASPRRSAAMVDAFRAKVVKTAEAINSGEFPAKPSEKACSWCDHKAACPAWRPA